MKRDACPMCSRKVAFHEQVEKALADRAEAFRYAEKLMAAMRQAISLFRELGINNAAEDLAETLAGAPLRKKGTLAERSMPWVDRGTSGTRTGRALHAEFVATRCAVHHQGGGPKV